jgi:NADH dehydrogenase/NADH:ubiquinone oxidoreductase subunit G
MTRKEASSTGGAKKQVTVTINGKKYPADEGEILLGVAVREKIAIPHLCYEPSLDPYGACRLCMVEVIKDGKREMTTSCTLRAAEGLEVVTDTPAIVKYRNVLFELYLAEAPKSEVIKEMAARYGVTKTRFLKKLDTTDSLGNKCVLCGLCVRACTEIMGAGAIGFVNRGPYTVVNTPYFEPTKDCFGCGACVKVCPTKAVEFEDVGSERVMTSWSGTKVPLARCDCCGGYYAPKALAISTLAHITPSLREEIAALCPVCRGRRIARDEILAGRGGGAGSHG